MDSTTTATTIALKDLSLSPGKTLVQSKEKLLTMNSNPHRSSQLPRSRPTTADPGSKTTMSSTKQTAQRVGSEASKLPSKYIAKKNTDQVADGVVSKTNEKNLSNMKNVSGGKPIGNSKIHRNLALNKSRNPSKSVTPKKPPPSECTSDNDSPALDELKVVTELNDKFRPRSDSESSHASHSSFCSQLSTSSVKSSICLPSADKSGLGKTKRTLTSSCSRLAVSRSETQMHKQPSMLSRTTSSTTVSRASNSALSSVSKMSPDHQASRLRSKLGTESLQRAVSTGSLRNTNSKLSIPTGRSNPTTTVNKTNTQPLKTKKVTNSTSDLSTSNRTLNKSGTKVPVRETTRTISTENLSVKHQNSLGKSCENLTKKSHTLLQASCENLSSKVRSNRSSALSNHTTNQKSSLLQNKKPSLSRSTSSSNSSLAQQREKSSSCASLVKAQRHTGFKGSTSSLPAAEKTDNKRVGTARPGTERKATGIGGVQGSRTNLTDKSQVRRTAGVANKKVTAVSNTADSVGKKKTLPRAIRHITDPGNTSTAMTPTTKSSFGMKKTKILENQSNKGVSKIPDKVSQNESPAKRSSVNDSNKTELNKGREKSVANDTLSPEEPVYKTNEISIENEEKLNEDNSLTKGKVSKNFAYDDYMLITDALSYENLSEPDVFNGDSDREDKVNHICSPDKGLLRNNLSTSSLDISLHEDYVSDEGVVVNSITTSDHSSQQEPEEFPPIYLGKQASPASACEEDVSEKNQDINSELSNHRVIKSGDVFSDKALNSQVIYKSNVSTSLYQQQQQQHNKHHPNPLHPYPHPDHSEEFWSGLEEEREKKQGVVRREGKGVCSGPETNIHSVNDRECVLAGKIKQEEVIGGEEDKEEEGESKGKERGKIEGKVEVVPVVGLKSADIYRAAGPGMPMPEFRPPHIGQHQHPQYITSRNEHTATGGCNPVGTGGNTSKEVTEATTETGGKAASPRRQLEGSYEKQNYPIHQAANTTTTTQHRGGDKTGLLTQIVAGKEADSLDYELQSRLDVEPIVSLVERKNVCDIDPQKMTDPLRVQSKQLKFSNYQIQLTNPHAENPCNRTEGDNENENLSKEDLLMEGPASSDLVTRVRGPFLASEMGILGGQMLSPCSNDSSSFKDISDDVVTPLSDVQGVFDHDTQHSEEEEEEEDTDSNFEQNEVDDEKHDDTPGSEEESDSGSVLIEIEDSPLQVSVGNDEGEIIVEEQDYVSEERNYSDSNSSFVSDMIMGERPIVDAGEDLAEVTLDGNETQNLWLVIETESQYDNMSTCMTLENIAESSIGEDVEELFDQSPNVEIDNNSMGIPEKVPNNKKLDFFKEIPSQEFDVDSPDLPDGEGSYTDDRNTMMENNSLETMENNSNEQEFDVESSDKELLLHSSINEICKPVDSLDENNPPRVDDTTVDNFKSQVPKEILGKTEFPEGYLPNIDVNSNKDIRNGKCQFSDPVYCPKFDRNEQISCYNVSQEIHLEDGNFAILKSDGSKKSKDSNAQDFTLRQLQGTLNLRKQRILELCGQTEVTPNKNQKPPPSPSKLTEKIVRPTSFKSTDTLSTSPQSSSLSPSPTRLGSSSSINIPNSEMVQSSGSNSDGQNSPMKESWIKHEGKWKRCYVLDDGKCIPTEEFKIKSPMSPSYEIIQNSSERYENNDERVYPFERPADINVDRFEELNQNLAYEEAPTPVARSFNEGPEKLLFNTNELMRESSADESLEDTQVQEMEDTLVQEMEEDTQVQESRTANNTNSKKYDFVDGIQHDEQWTGENDSPKPKYLDIPEDVKNIQAPFQCNSSQVQLELAFKSPTDPTTSEKKSFSPEIVDDIPFVDMDYPVLPSLTETQKLHSPEIKDVKSLYEKEGKLSENPALESTILKDSIEEPHQGDSLSAKPFSAPTRPLNLDVKPSVEMDAEPSSEVNTVTQVNLDGLPRADFNKVLIKDSTDVSSVDLENEPSAEPDSSSVHLSKEHLISTEVDSISKQIEEPKKPPPSENIKIEESEKITEELNKNQPPKTDVISQDVDSNQPTESGMALEQGEKLPKMDIMSQELDNINQKESVVESEEFNHEFACHELDNEQPEECDTPPADYIANSFDGSGTRIPANMQTVTPVGAMNSLSEKSGLINKRDEFDRNGSQMQMKIRPSNFEREIQPYLKDARQKSLKTKEAEDRMQAGELSALQAESELYKSDQDLTKVGSLYEEIFSIIGSPSLLHESWKTISSESSYEDASDMSSSQMESDDGRYPSRFSGGSSIYRSKSGSRSIYANILRSSIHENSDSESSDYQDFSMMTKSAQDYENLKRTKEKANNKLKGRGYWSDENSPDSLLSSMDLYSDASEFAHACWSDRSTFGDATYQYASPYKYRNDSSVFGKSSYAMKPEESHDIKRSH